MRYRACRCYRQDKMGSENHSRLLGCWLLAIGFKHGSLAVTHVVGPGEEVMADSIPNRPASGPQFNITTAHILRVAMSTPDQPQKLQPKHHITCRGKEYLDRTVITLVPIFESDPLFAWLLHDRPPAERSAVRSKLIRALFTAGSLNKAMFVEVDNFGCCGVVMPPGSSFDNPFTMIQAGLVPAYTAAC